ncbi:MAG: helix-turn-helix transcriptional regulator [Lachnospiraceae bacterium]|jgi:AraC-like DNA-binding protein|nr:helix-turn-helix transcriptional regulator [Lachnospiraceae bacterium]
MSFINIQVPPFPWYSHSGNAIYRPGDKHNSRKGVDFFDLLMVETGTLYMLVGKQEFTISKDHVLLIPPYTPHQGSRICTEKTLFHWLHFNTNETIELSDVSHRQPWEPNTDFKENKYILSFLQEQALPDATAQNVLSILKQLERRSIDFFTDSRTVLTSDNNLFHQQELLMRLLNILAVTQDTSDHNSIAYSALQYINFHYAEQFTMDDLAKTLNCHPSHLIRCVKKQYGVTPNQLLNKIRLERACAMLKDPYLSITTVAYSVGFSSTSYFCKQFKKNYEYSPKEFRDYIWGNPTDDITGNRPTRL